MANELADGYGKLKKLQKVLAEKRRQDINHAVNAAVEAAKEFYGGEELKGVLLEEVEMTPDSKSWLITLGFNVANRSAPSALKEVGILPKFERKYKVFTVDAKTRQVTSMKIRKV